MIDEIIGLFVVLTIAITLYKIIELKHRGGKHAEEFRHRLSEELSDRDDRAAALEERVRVLEKIITDNHASYKLTEEIEKLKER